MGFGFLSQRRVLWLGRGTGYGGTQIVPGCLGVSSIIKIATFIREDLGLGPGLAVGSSFNLVGSRFDSLLS